MNVSSLHYYPIKSCKGNSLDRATLDLRGIKDDRILMLVNPAGRFLSQREFPRMALIEAQLSNNMLSLHAPGMPVLSVECYKTGKHIDVTVWDDFCQGIEQQAEASQWFSDFLHTPSRLIRLAEDFVRPVDPEYATRADAQVGFADGYPFLIVSQGSLDDLNARLDTPVAMIRFRPSIVVTGCAPYAEDQWKQIRIAGITFDLVKPCARCAIPTIDPDTAHRDQEPIHTLATYRNFNGKILFGQNAVHDRTGPISVGDIVKVIDGR